MLKTIVFYGLAISVTLLIASRLQAEGINEPLSLLLGAASAAVGIWLVFWASHKIRN